MIRISDGYMCEVLVSRNRFHKLRQQLMYFSIFQLLISTMHYFLSFVTNSTSFSVCHFCGHTCKSISLSLSHTNITNCLPVCCQSTGYCSTTMSHGKATANHRWLGMYCCNYHRVITNYDKKNLLFANSSNGARVGKIKTIFFWKNLFTLHMSARFFFCACHAEEIFVCALKGYDSVSFVCGNTAHKTSIHQRQRNGTATT